MKRVGFNSRTNRLAAGRWCVAALGLALVTGMSPVAWAEDDDLSDVLADIQMSIDVVHDEGDLDTSVAVVFDDDSDDLNVLSPPILSGVGGDDEVDEVARLESEDADDHEGDSLHDLDDDIDDILDDDLNEEHLADRSDRD